MVKMYVLLCLTLILLSCNKSSDETSATVNSSAEMAQQVGDMTSSIDEAGGSLAGAFAQEVAAAKKTFARLSQEPLPTSSILLPQAQAQSCATVAFDACGSMGQAMRVRTFEDCSMGTAILNGEITLTWTGANESSCQLEATAGTIRREPNYTIETAGGGVYVVASPSTGQLLERTGANTYTFTNAGINRIFNTAAYKKILDITTTTGVAIGISGSLRNSRVLTGGTLTVTNNLTNSSCTLSPAGVSWSSGCSCPTSGSWSGSCDDSSSFAMNYTSTCGEVEVTSGGSTQTVELDRCY